MEGRLVTDRASVLLLADDSGPTAETVGMQLNALLNTSRHDVRLFNPRGIAGSLSLDLDEFDAVIVHWTLLCCSDSYLHRSFREKLHRYSGLKVQMLQDEYRWVNDVTAAVRYMGIDVLFSGTRGAARQAVYGTALPGVKILDALMGYVPDWPRPAPGHPRPIDVGYRGRVVPFWLGELGQEKVYIARRFQEEAGRFGLKVDIKWQEADRLYGPAWVGFLSSCKAVLGTESGSSITDWDRSVENGVKAYLAEHPTANFDEVAANVLRPYEGNLPHTACSPRVFEAAALGTGLIMFPGEYWGIVQPWRNYIPLAKDFSNMCEVVARLRDPAFMQAMTERTYADLIASGRYSLKGFVKMVDDVLDCATPRPHSTWRYRLALAERPVWALRRKAMTALGLVYAKTGVPALAWAGRVRRRWLEHRRVGAAA